MTGYGGVTPSSESGELASYGMDTSSLGGAGGIYPQESSSYTSNTSYNYQQTVQTQHAGVAAGHGEGSVLQQASGQSGLAVYCCQFLCTTSTSTHNIPVRQQSQTGHSVRTYQGNKLACSWLGNACPQSSQPAEPLCSDPWPKREELEEKKKDRKKIEKVQAGNEFFKPSL